MARKKLAYNVKKNNQICILLNDEQLQRLKELENRLNLTHSAVFQFGFNILSSTLEKAVKNENNGV